jgi:hypothetical protein
MRKTLAVTLRLLGATASKAENQATALLEYARSHKLTTPAKFSVAISKAYAINGWHATRGRPKAGAVGTAVPRAVRQYVHEIKAALLAKIDLERCDTLYALRKAVAESKARQREEKAPEMKGVALASPGKLNGALLHDVAVVYSSLKPVQRELMQKSLARLLAVYTAKPAARLLVRVAAAAPASDEGLRKAA